MLALLIIICVSQVSAWGGPPYTTDKTLLEKETLALVGKLGASQTVSDLVLSVTGDFYSKNLLNCYLVDCRQNANPLCQSDTDVGLEVYSYGRPVKYVGKLQKERMAGWANAVLQRKIPELSTKEQIVEAVRENGYAFVYFPSNISKDSQMYTTLSLKYLSTSLFTVSNESLRGLLEMNPGNLTMYKNPELERESFPHANSWERWESFLATYSYPGVNYLDSGHLTSQRFRENSNIKWVGLFVDHSHFAQQHIDTFYKFSKNNTSGLQMRLYLDYLRQSQLIKIYYHIRPKQFPALVFVSLINQSLNVSIRQGAFTTEDLDLFCQKANNGQLENFYLSDSIPENNGYIGKGVEKQIQKVVYSNFEEVVLKSKPTYVVMYTSVGQGCGNCQQSYSDFKKLKSYFEDQDIVFARFQFVSNYIPETRITSVPQVVIYKEGEKDKPITERYLTRFDEVLRLIRKHVPLQNEQL